MFKSIIPLTKDRIIINLLLQGLTYAVTVQKMTKYEHAEHAG
jgi:hypothetical protein